MLQAIALWKKAIALQPYNSTYERAISRDALVVQDYKTAYDAVKRVLVLEPSAPDKKQADEPAQAAEAADQHLHGQRQHHSAVLERGNTLQRVWQTVSSA